MKRFDMDLRYVMMFMRGAVAGNNDDFGGKKFLKIIILRRRRDCLSWLDAN